MSASGFIVLDKPTGVTSQHALYKLRSLLRERHAGFAGTLDPLATGVLLTAFGPATALLAFRESDDKSYSATITLGTATTTDDSEGSVIAQGNWRSVTASQVEQALEQLRGAITQRPPAFSAISVGGERLYSLARQGKPVTAPSRTVTIFRLVLHAWHPPTLEIDVDCSKGTYIRALARDLGEMLGCFAHMSALRRTRAGPFLLNDALTLDEAVARGSTGTLPELLRPLHAGIPDIPQHVLEHDVVQRVRHGQRVAISAADGLTALLTLDGTLVAVGTVTHGVFQPKRVLAQGEESPTSVSARYGAE